MTIINNEAELREYTSNIEVFDSELSRNGYIKDFKPKEYPFGLIEYINIEAECGVSYIAVYPSAFPQPKAKKLEWKKGDHLGEYYAETGLYACYYQLEPTPTKEYRLNLFTNHRKFNVGTFATRQLAELAANEDFEHLVKSCLINNGE